MDSYMSMKEVCLLLDISRRVIQGYQNEKLINPQTRNKYGYLLFSENEVDRIILIRFFQNIGFSLKDIHGFIDSEPKDISSQVQKQMAVMLARLDRQKELISVTEQVISALEESPMAYKSMQEIVDNIEPTAQIISIIKSVYNFKAEE